MVVAGTGGLTDKRESETLSTQQLSTAPECSKLTIPFSKLNDSRSWPTVAALEARVSQPLSPLKRTVAS